MKSIAPSVEREVQKQLDTLLDGGSEIITVEELEEKISNSLVSGNPLRVKQGIDPTSPHVHLGHMVPFAKMRQFQDHGHTGVLIIGDFTAQIGDPTDRTSERTRLSHDETRIFAETYTRQIFMLVDESRTETLWQSSWFSSFSLTDCLELAGEFSVAHLLSHETFRKRLAPGFRLSLHEMLYPVLQAWDSVQVQADVELGGTDQRFNILCGRDLMRSKGLEPQVALLVPLLPGTDGRKMSKSFGNHIPVTSTAEDMIGKLMSISDECMAYFMTLSAGLTESETGAVLADISSGDKNPRDVKMDLAKRICGRYHSPVEVSAGAAAFTRVFSEGGTPHDIDSVVIETGGSSIVALMTDYGLASSASDARRLIQQGGVSVDGEKIGDIYFRIEPAAGTSVVVRVGKRRFLEVCGQQ